MLEAIAGPQPRLALNWLRNGAGAGVLADVAAGQLAATHEALDAHPRPRAADYLRHMLTAGGACRPATRNSPAPSSGSPGCWTRSSRPADRRLVQAYATWQVMRRLRASARNSPRPATRTAHARNNIRAAASLLAWLRSRGTTLAAAARPTSTTGWPPARQPTGPGLPDLGRLAAALPAP